MSGKYLFKILAISLAGILCFIKDNIRKKVSIIPNARTKELKRLKNITTKINNTIKTITSIYISIISILYVIIISFLNIYFFRKNLKNDR